MTTKENLLGKNHFTWLTLAAAFFTVACCLRIYSFTIEHLIGTTLLNTVVLFLIEIALYKITTFRLQTKQGITLLSISLFCFVCAVFKADFVFCQLGLSFISGFSLLVFIWGLFNFTDDFINRIVGLFMIFGALMALLYLWQNLGNFSPDSFSYYEIASSIGKDFGKINTIRQYVIKSDYNISFPYFYPTCIFLVDKISGLGRYSGVLFNLHIMLFTVLLFLRISRNYTGRLRSGGFAAFLLFSNKNYLNELCAARAIPLALFLTTWCFYIISDIFFRKKKSPRWFFLSGTLAGFVMITRFDGLALVGYCALLMLLINNKKRIRNLILYLFGACIAVSPWILYSMKHFGRLWISDNSGTAFLVTPSVPTRIVMPGDSTLTLFNAPMEWLHGLLQKTYHIIFSLICCSYMADITIFICFIFIVYLIVQKRLNPHQWIVLIAMAIYCIGKTAMYILVGYADARYHTESVILASFVLLMICSTSNAVLPSSKKVWSGTAFMLLLTIYTFRVTGASAFLEAGNMPLENIEKMPEECSILDKELHTAVNDETARLFFLDGSGYSFGGWTKWKTYANPAYTDGILEWKKIEYAMTHYVSADYILLKKDTTTDLYKELLNSYTCTELTDYWLFKI